MTVFAQVCLDSVVRGFCNALLVVVTWLRAQSPRCDSCDHGHPWLFFESNEITVGEKMFWQKRYVPALKV